MTWAIIITSLLGMVGVLYGLLERSKRQAAERNADLLAKEVNAQVKGRIEDGYRYEALVSLMRSKLLELQKEINANIPREKLTDRLNTLLKWGVREPPKDDPGEPGLPPTTAP